MRSSGEFAKKKTASIDRFPNPLDKQVELGSSLVVNIYTIYIDMIIMGGSIKVWTTPGVYYTYIVRRFADWINKYLSTACSLCIIQICIYLDGKQPWPDQRFMRRFCVWQSCHPSLLFVYCIFLIRDYLWLIRQYHVIWVQLRIIRISTSFIAKKIFSCDASDSLCVVWVFFELDRKHIAKYFRQGNVLSL